MTSPVEPPAPSSPPAAASPDAPSVVIAFKLAPAHVDALRERFPDVAFTVSTSKAHLHDIVRQADVLFGWPSDEVIARATRLRWLHLVGAGADGFAAGPVLERGIVVTNSRGVAATNIAEHTLGLMIAFSRSFHRLFRAQAAQRWLRQEDLRLGEIGGRTLGILGLGEIGQSLALKARALGMTVIGTRRHPRETPGVDRVFGPLETAEVAAACDHLVACLPATHESRGLVDRSVFARMRPGSFVYNVGRGSAIVTDDLLDALDRGLIAGAGLDVTDPEPLPPGHRLWDHPDVLITCHTAGNTDRYWDRGLAVFARNLAAYRAGAPLENRVDLARGY